MSPTTRVICHRGYHANCPENSMDAFQRAVDLGTDGIEIDVRLTADDQAVLFHDRVLADGREVARLTHHELSEAAGHAVPTLTEALDAWPDVWWLVELKTPAALTATHGVLSAFADSRRLLFISFWHRAIVEACQSLYIPCGITISHQPNSFATIHGLALRPPQLNTIVCNYEFLDPKLVEQAHEQRWDCIVYNAITPDDHRQCQQLELAGVITDYPEQLLER